MARRISSFQLRSKVRQAQSKIRKAQAKQKQAINKFNQEVRAYNSKVRTHNARVKANRERLRRELQTLARTPSKPQYATLRTSVETVQRSYMTMETRAEANLYDARLDRFLDLSEQEAANSASVVNALEADAAEDETDEGQPPSEIDHILESISKDVCDRLNGALFALNPKNPDAARHFCTSARELLAEILEKFAADDDVKKALPNCEVTQQAKPTRRSKVSFFFHSHGISDDAITNFVDDDLENVVQLFRVFNDGTHGSSGKFGHAQLLAIRGRVENAVSFLWGIITGSAFSPA